MIINGFNSLPLSQLLELAVYPLLLLLLGCLSALDLVLVDAHDLHPGIAAAGTHGAVHCEQGTRPEKKPRPAHHRAEKTHTH